MHRVNPSSPSKSQIHLNQVNPAPTIHFKSRNLRSSIHCKHASLLPILLSAAFSRQPFSDRPRTSPFTRSALGARLACREVPDGKMENLVRSRCYIPLVLPDYKNGLSLAPHASSEPFYSSVVIVPIQFLIAIAITLVHLVAVFTSFFSDFVLPLRYADPFCSSATLILIYDGQQVHALLVCVCVLVSCLQLAPTKWCPVPVSA